MAVASLAWACTVLVGSTWYSDGTQSKQGPPGTVIRAYATGAFQDVAYTLVLGEAGDPGHGGHACMVTVDILNPTNRFASTSGFIGTTVGTVHAGSAPGTYQLCFKDISPANTTGTPRRPVHRHLAPGLDVVVSGLYPGGSPAWVRARTTAGFPRPAAGGHRRRAPALGPERGSCSRHRRRRTAIVIPEVPVTATDLRRAEANNSPALAADPTQPRFVALAHRADAPEFACGLQVSGDGGRGWQPPIRCPSCRPARRRCYAPEVAFDREGRLYYLFVGLPGPGQRPDGRVPHQLHRPGPHFAAPRMVLGPENYMVRMAIDRHHGPPRAASTWCGCRPAPTRPSAACPPAPNPIVAAHSDDGGRTFTEPVQVSDPARPRAVAPAVAVGPDHAVHVAYYDLRDDAVDYQGLEGRRRGRATGRWSWPPPPTGRRASAPGVVVDDAPRARRGGSC